MLIAELRRKLADLEDIDPQDPSATQQVRTMLHQAKEDLLTADVFGALKYLPRRPYLDAVIRELAARNRHAGSFHRHVETALGVLESYQFSFWPGYPTPLGLRGTSTVPDVELSNQSTLFFFEAKLHSGFGETQLERELALGLDQADGREFFLVTVTREGGPPRPRVGGRRVSFEQYLQAQRRAGLISGHMEEKLVTNGHRVLGISWHGILHALERATELHRQDASASVHFVSARDLVSDLAELLELRNILPFHGLSNVGGGCPLPISPLLMFEMPRRVDLFGGITATRFKAIARVSTGLPMPVLIPEGLHRSGASAPSWQRIALGFPCRLTRWIGPGQIQSVTDKRFMRVGDCAKCHDLHLLGRRPRFTTATHDENRPLGLAAMDRQDVTGESTIWLNKWKCPRSKSPRRS